ncbi:MAG: hypothetical protein J6C52_10660, partial [Clostridia bacterium]|nr:hypothetical protein [Clostridia bacterium]
RARHLCAASSVTGVSDTGATFPKGEGTGERLLAFLHLFAKAFPASGKVSLAVRPMTDEAAKRRRRMKQNSFIIINIAQYCVIFNIFPLHGV